MARRPPTDEQVRAGSGWGTCGLIAAGAVLYGMATDDGTAVFGGVVALVLFGILGAFGGA